MAGLSSRFKKAGYTKPKFMLEAHGKTLFSHAVNSFSRYFDSERFLFIAQNFDNTKDFVESELKLLGVKNFEVVILPEPTRGQAETVYLGVQQSGMSADTPLTIFNIDTFRPGFQFPSEFDLGSVDGYLETFIGSGKNWSNILPKTSGNNMVELTAEKQEISEYCCTGLYHWKSASSFCKVFESTILLSRDELQGGEYYIAPMYNQLIQNGGDVRYSVVERNSVIFCGVPSEYQDFLISKAIVEVINT
jgi:hypothetical protein